jgi:Flp pilus assembly protein TadD
MARRNLDRSLYPDGESAREEGLQRAVAMDPNNSITHHLLGQAYRDLGRNEDAEGELKLAEQLQDRERGKQ